MIGSSRERVRRRAATRFAVAALTAVLLPAIAEAAAPVVVIDAGHGGGATGTRTPTGIPEKTIVLGVARHAKRYLESKGVRVVMTRTTDVNVGLSRRASLANDVGATAFVSIHANYAPVPQRRGCETYVLSAEASDEDASALLHLEEGGEEEGRFLNEESFGGGNTAGGDVDFILADLARSVAHRESARLAKRIQDQLGRVGGLRPSRGLRQAPFKVLKRSRMAAALVELGYLSNAKQGSYLATARGQKAAGRALGAGIVKYVRALDGRR